MNYEHKITRTTKKTRPKKSPYKSIKLMLAIKRLPSPGKHTTHVERLLYSYHYMDATHLPTTYSLSPMRKVDVA